MWTYQNKEGKNKEGGLNEKGRKSYEKANPGSDLKALFRERVEKDLDLPSEHFNLFKGNKTKITRNK